VAKNAGPIGDLYRQVAQVQELCLGDREGCFLLPDKRVTPFIHVYFGC